MIMLSFNKEIIYIVVMMCALSLSGCVETKSDPATFNAMIPASFETKHHDRTCSVRVEVFGGRDAIASPNHYRKTGISNNTFKTAVTKSLMMSGVFPVVTDDRNADYVLEILIERDRYAGTTVTLITQWELLRSTTNELMLSEIIVTSHDAPSSAELRGGYEGAAMDNIQQAIAKIDDLSDL